MDLTKENIAWSDNIRMPKSPPPPKKVNALSLKMVQVSADKKLGKKRKQRKRGHFECVHLLKQGLMGKLRRNNKRDESDL